MSLVPTSGESAGSDHDDVFCPQCAYNLRGLRSPRCSECGHEIDWDTIALSRIPWEHRHEIGVFIAYWRTVFMAMFHPEKVGAEVIRPSDYHAARRFQMITVLLAFVPLALLVAAGDYDGIWRRGFFGEPDPLASNAHVVLLQLFPASGYAVPGAAYAFVLVFLLAATGVGSYLHHAKGQSIVHENRAISLSYYGCAALACMALPVALLGAAWQFDNEREIAFVLNTAAALGFGGIVLCWWSSAIHILSRSTHAGMLRTNLHAILIAVIWKLTAALTLVAIPAAIGFLALVVASFR